MLIPPNSPVPDDPSYHSRIRDVLALGLTQRNQTCPPPVFDTTVPYPVAVAIAQAQQPGAVALQSNPSTLSPATIIAGGEGATFSPSDFAGAPQVQPMNLTPEMRVQSNPQALMERRNKRKQAASRTSGRSAGVQWGQMPSVRAGSECGPSTSLLGTLQANPLAALLIVSGLGVIVYAVVKK
jgi:hypothetical protein